jgi:glycerol uptake facilitator-like aquaporin
MSWRSAAPSVAAECIATALLLATVVGSGIMGVRLAGGNVAIALLANSLATAAMLAALILTFGPVSGAHMNPVVTLALAAGKMFAWRLVPAYLLAQVTGAFAGVWLAHVMFELPVIQLAVQERSGPGQWLGEFTATFALLAAIISCSRHRKGATAFAVAAVIGGAYWFTSSTAFANPAVTIARAFTDTFAGIRGADAPAFILAQLLGAGGAAAIFAWVGAGDGEGV